MGDESDYSESSAWSRCVAELLPDDRWLLELGNIDPSKPVCVRDDGYMPRADRSPDTEDEGDSEEDPELREMNDDWHHPGRFSHAAPLCFLQVYAILLEQLRPPPEHPFHRFWKRRRLQEMGLVSSKTADSASLSNQDSDDEPVLQPQKKKPRLVEASSACEAADYLSGDDDDDEDPLQASHVVKELLSQYHARNFPNGWLSGSVKRLSPKEQRELAPLIPGGQELSAKKLAKKVQESKTQLILELVLEDRVRTLLEFGANPNPEKSIDSTYSGTPFRLPLVAESCPTSVVRLLLEGKADPNWALLQDEYSPLWVHRRNPETVRLLLEAGANPDYKRLSGRTKSLTIPVRSPVFLSFVQSGVPADSVRALLEHNPEIIGQSRELDGIEYFKTPISKLVSCYKLLPHVQDIVLSIPYPIPEQCHFCARTTSSCWKRAMSSKNAQTSLTALVRVGYPTRGLLDDIIQSPLDLQDADSPKEGAEELLEILKSVTEEGQAQHRQEHLGGFWAALMQAVPGVSGVVASLVLQAIVPEFKLRIA